jgi:hypothetical protein
MLSLLTQPYFEGGKLHESVDATSDQWHRHAHTYPHTRTHTRTCTRVRARAHTHTHACIQTDAHARPHIPPQAHLPHRQHTKLRLEFGFVDEVSGRHGAHRWQQSQFRYSRRLRRNFPRHLPLQAVLPQDSSLQTMQPQPWMACQRGSKRMTRPGRE